MRYPTDHKRATRARILDAAGAAFRRRGMAGAGIDGLMADAGLTAGGFYAHFPSKAALLAAVVERLLPRGAALLSAGGAGRDGHAFARAAASCYLSPEHRDAPEDGCPLPALLSDLPRAGDAPRRSLADGVRRMAAELGPRMPAAPGLSGEDRVLATLALGAGGVALARAVPDPALSDRILAACRALATPGDPGEPPAGSVEASDRRADRRPTAKEDRMDLGNSALGHLAIRVTDPARSRRFYHEQLGLPVLLDTPQVTLLGVGGVALALLAGPATPAGDRFDPHRVGLDHVALTVADADLARWRARLDEAAVPNNGIQRDDLTGARYVAFYDPDGIAWELYAAPAA